MDLYKKLGREPIRPEPDVWISRLVIFEKTLPEPVILQDVPLSRGLNIIVAKEAEDEELPAGITGHSAGKTTFCRFLRYALGEKTFGKSAVTKLIRKAFPEGYVAAQLHIRGRKWAVMRPIGGGWASYAKENASIEELLQNKGYPISLERYPQTLGLEAFKNDLATSEIVQIAESIRWVHLLAWCTRDQETRFQSLHEWRSQRSESEPLSFRTDSRVAPHFIMRLVLGLFLEDEVKTEKRIAELDRQRERLTKELEEKGREPEYRVNLYDSQLRQALKEHYPTEPDLDSIALHSEELIPLDLTQLTRKAQKQMENDLELNLQKLEALQKQRDDLGAELSGLKDELEKWENLFDLNAAATQEMEFGLSEKKKELTEIEKSKDRPCPYGSVLIRACVHVQRRQQILQISDYQDSHAMEKAKAQRDEEVRRINNEKDKLRASIQTLEKDIDETIKRRKALGVERDKIKDASNRLQGLYDAVLFWTAKHDQPGGYEELDRLRDRLKTTEDEISRAKEELVSWLKRHNESKQILATIFSGAVKSVLPTGGYDGKVDIERELQFELGPGAATAGEAVETLTVLLADVSCLVFNSLSASARLPGLLVHDSPREADLGRRLYGSFIRLVAGLQAHFGSADACPFQYILTTTTPPPQELDTDKYVKLRLNAGERDKLLLRRNIAEAPPPVTLLFE